MVYVSLGTFVMKYLMIILLLVAVVAFLVFFDTYEISLYKDTPLGDLLVRKNKKTGSVSVFLLQIPKAGWISLEDERWQKIKPVD